MSDVIITEGYKRCFEYIDDDIPVILVSGEAGTGKSVLIDQIEKKYPVRTIIKVAPTGIAALNIGGVTMHSFFRLPMGVLTEQKVFNLIGKMMRYGSGLFDSIDMLIIEEISMVRADMLDAINTILQRMRRCSDPFGGVQTIMVGDLFQLPPVVTEEDEETYFRKYETEYFFGSKIFQTIDTLMCMEVILLKEVFRQSDELFVNILNQIRVNENTKMNTKILNEVCFYDPNHWDDKQDVTLCMTNIRAQQINNTELRNLDGQMHKYVAEVTGEFKIKLITPDELYLKVGAKVMFTKNSDLWVNGSMGIVKKLTDTSIEVEMIDSGSLFTVPRMTWEITRMKYVHKDNKIVEEVVGTFKQFPLTLAWAITVHKSQGLSFDKVTIDFGREAFAYGQVYVALSRCRSLDGLKFLRPLDAYDVKVDPRIVEFYKKIDKEYVRDEV